MITQSTFNGGARHTTTSANATLTYGARVHVITANAPVTISLPDARNLRTGLHTMIVAVVIGSTIVLQNNSGGVLVAALTVNQWAILSLHNNVNPSGVWSVDVRTRLT